jgi:prenyltransferase beta subunit
LSFARAPSPTCWTTGRVWTCPPSCATSTRVWYAQCFLLSSASLCARAHFDDWCQRYDGGIGIAPGAESHGGAAYCAIASLVLTGRVMQLEVDQSELVRWLVFRQQGGFQGRCNKDPDSCYAFWDGATLDLLGKHALVDVPSCEQFIFSCQFPFGGLCKFPDTVPDVMHSYYSLAWLSIAANSSAQGAEASSGGFPLPKLAPMDTKLQVPVFPKLAPKRA